MRAAVLGSAAGGGFPQWNCRCANCALAWAGDPRASWRTQASLALQAGDQIVLVNASPDIGAHIRATPRLQPHGVRQSPIAAVVLTSAEIDHVGGLITLRERHGFDILALPPVVGAISGNPWLAPLNSRWIIAEEGRSATFPGDLSVELFAVPGKVPLYLESGEPEPEDAGGDVAGLVAVQGGRKLVYVPGCAALSDRVRQEAASADAVLFDGTLFVDDEMLRAGLGPKTGRRMGHLPMTGEGGTLDWLASLPGRRIYTHINNSNPVLIEGSAERRLVEAAGVEIAFDGMEIVL